eukprot:Skav234937  [mRNA]  locus=scaffold2677:152512:155029:- [translate_table: standard]
MNCTAGGPGESGCHCEVCLALRRLRFTLTHPDRTAGYREYWIGRLQILAIQCQDAVLREPNGPGAPPPGLPLRVAPGPGVSPAPPVLEGGNPSEKRDAPPPLEPAPVLEGAVPKEETGSVAPRKEKKQREKSQPVKQEEEQPSPSANSGNSKLSVPAESSTAKSSTHRRRRREKERKEHHRRKTSRKEVSSSEAPRKRRRRDQSSDCSSEGKNKPLEGEKLRKAKAEIASPPRAAPRPMFRGKEPRTPSRSPPPRLRPEPPSTPPPGVLGLSAAPKAGVAVAKAKGKARAKAAARLRRPAAVLGRGRGAGVGVPLHRLAAAPGREPSEEVHLQGLAVGELLKVGALRILGKYWDAPVEFVGVPQGLKELDGEHFVRVEGRGTKQEALLRYLSQAPGKELLVHLCDIPCSRLVWQDGVVHLEKAYKVGDDIEEWMSNAMAVVPPPEAEQPADELSLLRMEQDRLAPGRGAEARGDTSKEKKRKKEPKEPVDLEEGRVKASSSKKEKGKHKKPLSDVFGGTGMDPCPQVRQKLRKKARRLNKKEKKKKQRKGSSSSGSSTKKSQESSSSEGSLGEGDRPGELFGETMLVRKIATKYPGVLCASWLRETQDNLMTSQGQLWSQVDGAVPPLAMQYYRQVVSSRMTGAMGREYQSLAFLLDLAVQGRLAEACDVAVQRMKSLSSTQSGVHYSISQRLELLPHDRAIPASLQETQAAARAAEQEDKVLHRASKPYRPWGAQGYQEPNKGGKGKDGKGKKGKNKDGKKGEEGKGGNPENKKG